MGGNMSSKTIERNIQTRFGLIINGYIRENNKLWKLNIPDDIASVVMSFYKLVISKKYGVKG